MLSVLNFPYSEQVVFVLFVSSHPISHRHQFQGYQTGEKGKSIYIYNNQRNKLSTLANQTHRYTKVNTYSLTCAEKILA